MKMLSKLKHKDFAAHLNKKFKIKIDDENTLEAELIEAVEVGPKPEKGSDRRQAFSLIFRGPKDFHLPQENYEFEHPKMGTVKMFTVPIAPDDEGALFQVTFN